MLDVVTRLTRTVSASLPCLIQIPEQILERLADLSVLPFEQMRGAVDDDELLRFLELRVERPEILQRAQLVEIALDEELGFGGCERVGEVVVRPR